MHQRICRKSKSTSDGHTAGGIDLIGHRVFGDEHRHHANLPHEQQPRHQRPTTALGGRLIRTRQISQIGYMLLLDASAVARIGGKYGVNQPRCRMYHPQHYDFGIRAQHQYERNGHCRRKNTDDRAKTMTSKALYSCNSQTNDCNDAQRSHRQKPQWRSDAGSVITSCLARQIISHSANRRTVRMQHHAAPDSLI